MITAVTVAGASHVPTVPAVVVAVVSPALLRAQVHLAEERVVAVQQVRDGPIHLLRPGNVPAQKVEGLATIVPEGTTRDFAQTRLREQTAPFLFVSEVRLEGGTKIGRFNNRLEHECVEAMLHVQKHTHVVWITVVLPNHDVAAWSEHSVHLLQKWLDLWDVMEYHVNRDHIEAVVTVWEGYSIIMLKHEMVTLVVLWR